MLYPYDFIDGEIDIYIDEVSFFNIWLIWCDPSTNCSM
jgi:hypothetical protein